MTAVPTARPPRAGDGKPVRHVDRIVVRLAGDSGDGIQLAGEIFTTGTAALGHGLRTAPDFPAEIRAPAGSLDGVSAFQLQFGDAEVLTAGDGADVLVALNPAALRRSLRELKPGGVLVCDSDAFTERALGRAGYGSDPLSDGTLAAWRLHALPLTSLTMDAVAAEPGAATLGRAEARRCTVVLALGLLCWLYQRDPADALEALTRKFGRRPALVAACRAAYRAGHAVGETTEAFAERYDVPPGVRGPGLHRPVHGNHALALGLVAAAARAGLPLFLGAYPITPASGILHELAPLAGAGVQTFQAEDEIAAIGAALGAAYGGALGVTVTSGPGMALKTEMLGLAVTLELPLVVVNVQRGGPSTGLPTKTEQSDLLQAVAGRNGEAPLPVLAARSPADCFDAAIEAVRIATVYRTPVVLLSDGHLAQASEPWRVPDLAELPDLSVTFAVRPDGEDAPFLPYGRDPETLARPWAVPGTGGMEHRIGGLEKADGTGEISYDPENHDRMVRLRADKVGRVARSYPPLQVDDPQEESRLLVVSWGSTYGSVRQACLAARATGTAVAHVHLRHLAPLPDDLGAVLQRYDRVLVPEANLGQLVQLLRARYAVDATSWCRVRGQPLRVADVLQAIREAAASTVLVEGPQ